MFYEVRAKTTVRVDPSLLSEEPKSSIFSALNKQLEGYISADAGFVIGVTEILNIGEGIIIPGDGAAFYETEFIFLSFLPEMQEVVLGKISDITNFGVFINIGAVDAMIHVSQTMDDYVSMGKQKILTGKQSKQVLKVGDRCKGRIIAISYKDITNPKIGLTMRQPGLGSLQWEAKKRKK